MVEPAPCADLAGAADQHGGPAAPEELGALTLDGQLCFSLYRATNAIVRTYRPLLRQLGLTYSQYIVMIALWEQPDQTPTRLAARLDLPVHGLGPVLERLERQGLLERRPDPADRRSTRVVLSEAGRALEPEAARAQREVVCRTRLDDDDFARLRHELDQLHGNLSP